ncbi:MAG: hypothetical protein COW27_03610 [Nitrosopumilales archaeon CG15_BIG_FIL_POST_REV_8_21_14_020_37_12]|nr:MAG: hypothetical protein COW27_03610 [Nitrosopumilales archaeon CG15_BIG_FIL_POST_REV_8_21_14_020_37_12]
MIILLQLNPDQLSAVEHKDSPLLVAAGPGSGKTRVIVERIIYLLKNGLKPSEILCLTFSEKAAQEMKERLEKIIDVTDMQISTFHSFCHDVLGDNVLDSGIGIGSGVMTRSSTLVWALKNIDTFGFEHIELGNNAVNVIEALIDGISTFKDELITPEELSEYLNKKFKAEKTLVQDIEQYDYLQKLCDLHKIYVKHQDYLKKSRLIDFDEMITSTIELFRKKPNVLARYHNKFKHVLVDEFQDNNYAQLELIKILSPSGNVTVVGDDDQSIYRFQGAFIANFQHFIESYKDKVKVIVLKQNYRSPPAPTLAQTRIQPDQEKIQYEISWPNIDRIERIFPSKITLDINDTKPLELKSNDFSLTVDMSGVISGKPVLETMSELDLVKLNAKIRIQWIIFQAAKQILPEIKQDWKGSQEDLMMQLVKIVEDFIESDKITVLNVDESDEIRRKLIIAFNLTKIVKHIASEIKISNTQERRLVLNKENPIKSTGNMQPWYTRKPNDPTLHSHINFTVHDSRWEAAATQELERNSQVESWAKNDHLGFKILYLFNGILHEYWPDYLVRLKNGITLVLEIKGEDSEQNRAKREAIKEWVEAVNEDGKFGAWSWDVAFDPGEVRTIIKKHNETIPSINYITKCPACGKTASSIQDIDKLFGFRNMSGFIRSQSWCRDCRKNKT